MAKLSVYFNQQKETQAALAVRGYNEKELLAALRNVGPCDQLPESIKVFLNENQLPRVKAVRLMPFERIVEADGTFYGEKSEENIFACAVQKEGHPFPLLLLYDPEWSKKAAKKGKVEAVRNLLKKRFDLELSNELAAIIRDELPDMLPAELRFEGSLPRFEALAQRKGNTNYSNAVVAHKLRTKDGDKPTWTIFVQDIDVISHFADHLVESMMLKPKLARRISESWGHDSYVSVQPFVWRDIKKFSDAIIYHGGLKEGDTVEDILNGQFEVQLAYNNQLYLDLDDALDSAIIVKGRLNVYVAPEPSEAPKD